MLFHVPGRSPGRRGQGHTPYGWGGSSKVCVDNCDPSAYREAASNPSCREGIVVTIRQLAALEAEQHEALCTLLADAVEGGASVGFLLPLSLSLVADYWRSVAAALDGGLVLLVAEEAGRIVGSLQLAPCAKENGAHRAEIQKLFVLRSARGRGVATRLIQAAEQLAADAGRTLLVLDTQEGSKAAALYAHLGWQKAGVIPGYAASPDGGLHATAYFYKHLQPG